MQAQTPDVKEVVGLLMHVVGGGEAKVGEIGELEFVADGALQPIINACYVQLLEFAFDSQERASNPALDASARSELEALLMELARQTGWRVQRQFRSGAVIASEAKQSISL